jgi:predicted outer membrane repeat protein
MSTRYAVVAAVMVVLNLVVGCGKAEPTATPVPPMATFLPPTDTPALPPATAVPPTDTPVPPTATAVPPTATATPSPTDTPVPPTETLTPTDTPIPPTATPIGPTATPLPATDTVCAEGCDFTTIQAALDDAGTTAGAIIEVTDSIHTEAGIVVDKDVTIRGLGAGDTIVQGHETPGKAPERVFLVEEGATVVFEKMTIRHGKPSILDEHGGGIMNKSTLTLKNCVVTDNVADGGGGICNNGELLLINSTVSNNTAKGVVPPSEGIWCGGGGGIKCEDGTLTLINSTISGNQAGIRKRGWGGGVHIGCNCTGVFTNSTISGNRSVGDSGGVRVRGRLQLANCTISNNTAAGEGGGVYVVGKLDYVNTIIANNRGRGGSCVIGSSYGFTFQGEGSIGTNRNNLVESGNCNPDYADDPKLGPLADNGGDTLTHALLPGSPAIDVIPVGECTVSMDQRWRSRPQGAACDIGAFELHVDE